VCLGVCRLLVGNDEQIWRWTRGDFRRVYINDRCCYSGGPLEERLVLAIGCLNIDCIILNVVLGKHYGPVRGKRPHGRYESTRGATVPSSSVPAGNPFPEGGMGKTEWHWVRPCMHTQPCLVSKDRPVIGLTSALQPQATGYLLTICKKLPWFETCAHRIDDHVVIPEVC
jgi:hypothetical protein